ncbi:MAG: HDOD domain-containing protein [Phycisphaerales bacterium]|nr:MAG: HDOD domain-containing protein [Phycisphaerales bacterium]
MNAKVLEAIKKSACVPSVPQVVTRFLEIMQDPHFAYDDLVKVLSADAGTVSEILRLVNSALFGVRQKIVSLRQALTLLGPKRTRSMLLGRYLVDSMSQMDIGGLDMSYFWRRSLASSVVASRFAGEILPRHRDEVFIGALLADIGIPILAEALPERYAPIAANYAPRGIPFTPDDEIEAVEATHAEVSAMVLAHWTLPDDVTGAVNLHQSQSPGEGSTASIARLLHASDSIAKLLCEIPEQDELTSTCTQATQFVGVGTDTLIALLPSIENDIEELAEVLRIDVIPSNVYALIAKTMQDKLMTPAATD